MVTVSTGLCRLIRLNPKIVGAVHRATTPPLLLHHWGHSLESPSTPFLKAAVERLHKYGVSVNTVTWTLGDHEDLYLRLWDLGFDHFTTDYPETMFNVIKTLGSRD